MLDRQRWMTGRRGIASIGVTGAILLAAAVPAGSLGASPARRPAAAFGPPAGAVLAFGDNVSGELGSTADNGTDTAHPNPTTVALPGQSGPVAQVAVGGNHSLGLTSTGQLYAFGSNDHGQLGSTVNNGSTTANPSPTLVTLPGQSGTIVQVSAGEEDSFALTSTGQLYGFGYNNYGELGNTNNNGKDAPNPTPTLITLPGQSGTITRVSAGAQFTLVLTSGDQLYSFGDNLSGQLGSTANVGLNLPNPTPSLVTLPGQAGSISQIAAGAAFSVVLTSSGQVFTFGNNMSGQLAQSTNVATNNPNPTPTVITPIFGAFSIVQIAAGGQHALALDDHNQLLGWGDAANGQLGTGSSAAANTVPIAVTPAPAGQIVRLVAGQGDSLVLNSSGQLFTFGDNTLGQLGIPATSGSGANPTPTAVALPGTTIDAVGTGPQGNHTLAIVSDLAVTSATLPAGQVGVPYSAALAAAGGAPPLTWSASGLPAGLSLNSASGAITGLPSTAGTTSVVVSVTDGARISAPAASIPVTIAPAAAGGSGGGGTGGNTAAPVLSGVSQTHSTWREGGKAATIAKRSPVGTTFAFSVNEAAHVTLAFARQVHGRRVNHKCVAPTRSNRHKPSCTRSVAAGALSFKVAAGAHTVAFQGQLSSSKKLGAGRYKVTVTATNSAGKRSQGKTLSFSIVRH
jgi:alpha-tubulin suppressor-like RCC1 family protein